MSASNQAAWYLAQLVAGLTPNINPKFVGEGLGPLAYKFWIDIWRETGHKLGQIPRRLVGCTHMRLGWRKLKRPATAPHFDLVDSILVNKKSHISHIGFGVARLRRVFWRYGQRCGDLVHEGDELIAGVTGKNDVAAIRQPNDD